VSELLSFLKSKACDGQVPWSCYSDAVKRYGVEYRCVEETALENGLRPSRYRRNGEMITTDQQLRLFCGGLGGYVIDELARLGVGKLVVLDPDVFEEHNLNRQILCTFDTLGKHKAMVAAQRVAKINPVIDVTAVAELFGADNGHRYLYGAQVAVDCLDSIPTRLELAGICSDSGVVLVHGAVAGWFGQVTVQFPGDQTLRAVYGAGAAERGVESTLGNLACTVGAVASLEAAEVIKILLGDMDSLRNRQLTIDLREMEFVEIPIDAVSRAARPSQTDTST